MELTKQQRRILEPAVRAVEAGPGAGKTRALVARFIDSCDRLDNGVALLSFTNAAVNEVRNRADSANVLHAPNFVGTIDGFLHRFIVTPAETQRLGRLPNYLASWDELPEQIGTIRINGVNGAGIPLNAFRLSIDNTVTLSEQGLNRVANGYLIQIRQSNMEVQLTNRARSIILGLVRGGTFDSSSARTRAYQLLSGNGGHRLLQRLTTRFGEILVDETQDCDPPEFQILQMLGAQIPVIIVADPDQAIFEFRGSSPDLFTKHRDSQPERSRIQLSQNHRSTPSICQIVGSLRTIGNLPSEPTTTEDRPILVLSGSADEQRTKFLQYLDDAGLSRSEAIVLSHRRTDAAKLAGQSMPTKVGVAAGNKLAVAIAILAQGRSEPTERLAAVQAIEQLILSLFEWPAESLSLSRIDQLEALGRDKDWLRSIAGLLVQDLEGCSRESIAPDARSILDSRLADTPVRVKKLGANLKKPSEEIWRKIGSAIDTSKLRYGTIHASKGLEYPAVLLGLSSALQKEGGFDLLDDWTAKRNSERLRVLYVGASRAEQLLAIGAGSHAKRVAGILSQYKIPFTCE